MTKLYLHRIETKTSHLRILTTNMRMVEMDKKKIKLVRENNSLEKKLNKLNL